MARDVMRPVIALVAAVDEYQVQVMSGISRTLDDRGIPLLAVSVDALASEDTPAVVLDLIRRREVQGVIALADASGFRWPDLPEALVESGIPTVTMSARLGRSPLVRGDNVSGMRALMGHLLDECAVRRPALVRGTPGHVDSLLRERVFREECAKRGLTVDEELVTDGWFRSKPSYDAVRDLLRRRPDVDAVVALNDPSALGAMSAVIDHGLRIPEDVLVTGFDNLPTASASWPPLTTVDQALAEQGSRSAALLLKLLAGEPCADEVEFQSRLVVRRSTRGREVKAGHTAAAARALQTTVALQQSALQLCWDLGNCRSLRDVTATLDPFLTQLGIRRCFVGLARAVADDGAKDTVPHPTALAFSYRDGKTEEASDEVFPRHQLLPSSLRAELAEGGLLLQSLCVDGRERGYLLYEINPERPLLGNTLRIELPRTVDRVLGQQELREQARGLERQVSERTRELEQVVAALQRSVMRDGLTGLANRTAFQHFLDDSWYLDGASGRRIALLMIDVDLFKAFNDHYGHLAGDDALKTVGSCLERSVRAPHDLACRYGGEEFAVILRDCELAGAMAVAKRFVQFLSQAGITHEGSHVAPVVTASVGVAATTITAGSDPTDLIAAANQALQRAKAEGRNRIVTDQGSVVPQPRTELQA